MWSKLLAGVAFGSIFLSLSSVAIVGTGQSGPSRDAAADPMLLGGAICRSADPAAGPTRLGRFLQAAAAYAQTAPESAPPKLIEGVASSALDITATDAARPWFEQGLGLMDGFNHAEAVRAFRMAQSLDPDCAMCFWGESLALGPNINNVMDPADNPSAVETARLALEKAGAATEVERALIEALQTRYSDDPSAERKALDFDYAAAMGAVVDRFPDNDQVQALHAEAIMDTQPWDYWEAGGRTPKGQAGEALARLETVLARNPDHVLAIHLHIHMTEASDDPWRSEPYAGRLASLAPGAGHLVHMPAHTWYRIGRFKDSIATNVDAVAVDEAYLAQAGDAASAIYRYGYYPHNLHFVLSSAQMTGDGSTVLDVAERLDAALPMQFADLEGWIQLIKAGYWFARVQFEDAAGLQAILDAPQPAEAPPYLEAAWRYARGEAAARLGDPEAALAEVAALEALDRATDWEAAIPWMPGADLVQIMRRTMLARAAIAANDFPAAIAELEQATDIQAALPYLEPPFWYYPSRQTLAAALLANGQAGRAEHEFIAALVESPDNGWAYWGLAEARAAQGDSTGADAARAVWQQVWAGTEEPTLDRL